MFRNDEDHLEIQRNTTVKKIGKRSRPSIQPQFQIKFDFFFKFITENWIRDGGSTTAAGVNTWLDHAAGVAAVRNKSLSYDSVKAAARKAIGDLLPDDGQLREAVKAVMEDTWRYCGSEPLPKHTILYLEFEICVIEIFFHPSSSSCSICLDEFCGPCCSICGAGALFRMPCSHVFHCRCIGKWLSRSNSCPLCRREIIFTEDTY